MLRHQASVFGDLSPTVLFLCRVWGRNPCFSWVSWTEDPSWQCPLGPFLPGATNPQVSSEGVQVPTFSQTYSMNFSMCRNALRGSLFSIFSRQEISPTAGHRSECSRVLNVEVLSYSLSSSLYTFSVSLPMHLINTHDFVCLNKNIAFLPETCTFQVSTFQ